MNIPTFFKILNQKIEQYDKVAVNPFIQAQPIVLIWIEEEKKENTNNS